MAKKKRSRKRQSFLVTAYLLLLLLAGFLLWQRPAVSYPEQEYGPISETPLLTVRFLDVGQGDAALLTTETHAVLIDGGLPGAGRELRAALGRAGVKKLDLVLLSHPHADHYGGLIEVVEKVPIGEFLMPSIPEDLTPTAVSFGTLLEALEGREVSCRFAEPGMTVSLGDAVLTVLAPGKNARYDSLNDYSILARVDCGETSFLFTGDAEKRAEKNAVEEGMDLNATVLKVGHHGSNTSSHSRFLEAVSPEIAVISVGEGNRYGLPSEKALARIKEQDIRIYRTDLQGTITLTSDGRKVAVKTER